MTCCRELQHIAARAINLRALLVALSAADQRHQHWAEGEFADRGFSRQLPEVAAGAHDRGAALQNGGDDDRGGISPMTDCAAFQALGLIPSMERTTAAVACKSRQVEIPPLCAPASGERRFECASASCCQREGYFSRCRDRSAFVRPHQATRTIGASRPGIASVAFRFLHLFEELPRLALSAKPTLTSALFFAFNPCKIVPARAISIPGRDTSPCARSNTFMSSATATP